MNSPPLHIALIGATGQIGREVLKLLSENPAVLSIEAITRTPLSETPAKTENSVIDFNSLESTPLKTKPAIFVCCLGTTLKKAGSKAKFRRVDYDYVLAFARLALKSGAQKFIVVSSLGANEKSGSFYSRVKGEMEHELRTIPLPEIEIFRPSLLLGDREESRPAETLAKMTFALVGPLFVGPLKKYRAIQASDVAKAVSVAVQAFRIGTFVYESNQIETMAKGV